MRDKQKWLMKMTLLTAEMSTCAKISVGAMIVKVNRIISIGYNGSAPGRIHCINYFGDIQKPYKNIGFLSVHHKWALINEIHAEMNAILFAAKEGIKIDGADMYVTHFPCTSCSKFIVQCGIKRVFYHEEYNGETDITIFRENKVEVKQV